MFVLSRTTGLAGKNISYIIVVTNPYAPNTDAPNNESLCTISSNNYKLHLQEGNFGIKANIRKDLTGSQPLEVFPWW